MKLKQRNTKRRVVSVRITSPETRVNPRTLKRELLLSYVDGNSDHQHAVTTADLFVYAAGSNEEGELPDGLDRLQFHKFVIHLDEAGTAVGLDILPNRVYRSQVIPASQRDVSTVRLTWLLDGAVVRCTQRPAGVTGNELIALVREFDAMADRGEEVVVNGKIGTLGRVVSISGDTVEIKLKASRPTANANDAASIVEAALDAQP